MAATITPGRGRCTAAPAKYKAAAAATNTKKYIVPPQFDLVQIVMTPWGRSSAHRATGGCVRQDTSADGARGLIVEGAVRADRTSAFRAALVFTSRARRQPPALPREPARDIRGRTPAKRLH